MHCQDHINQRPLRRLLRQRALTPQSSSAVEGDFGQLSAGAASSEASVIAPAKNIARPAATKELALSVRDESILQALAAYQFLTAEQLAVLRYRPGSLAYARSALRLLALKGCASRRRYPEVGPGGSPWVYTLTRAGVRHLASGGYSHLVASFHPPVEKEYSHLFLRHSLAITDVLIAATILTRRLPDLELAEIRHERTLRQRPVRVAVHDPGGSAVWSGHTVAVIPDAWLDWRFKKTLRLCVALEVDRGTEGPTAFQRKLSALLAFSRGPYQRAFHASSLTVAIATTAGAQRAARLIRWCEEILRELRAEHESDLFLVATLPPTRHGYGVDPSTLFLKPIWRRPFHATPLPLFDLAIGSLADHQ
jgi:hypothetical protein